VTTYVAAKGLSAIDNQAGHEGSERAWPVATCWRSPGRTASDSDLIDALEIKNGTLHFGPITATATVEVPTGKAAGCPNDNWNVTLGDFTVVAKLTVEQPPGTVIDSLTRTF
jgi:hypothetical protein